jgi:hypothetical protein
MGQWLRGGAAGVLFLAAIAPADARGSAGAAGFRAANGQVFVRPAVAAKPAERPRSEHAFRLGRHGWAFASGVGYGMPWGDGSYDPNDPGQVPLDDYPPPPLLYRYGPPPQLTCFRPRLITIGRPVPRSHLPRVVYGGPLPCGYKGV